MTLFTASGASAGAIAVRPSADSSATGWSVIAGTPPGGTPPSGAGGGAGTVPEPPVPLAADAGAALAASIETAMAIARTQARPNDVVRKLKAPSSADGVSCRAGAEGACASTEVDSPQIWVPRSPQCGD